MFCPLGGVLGTSVRLTERHALESDFLCCLLDTSANLLVELESLLE
jgi:hypothetical protein